MWPFSSRKTRSSRPTPRPSFRPRLTALEDRSLPSTLTVLNTKDGGAGSLRQAILDAAPGDTVAVRASGTINLSSTLTIDKDLTITGPGSSQLTVSGQYVCRDFYVAAGINVTLSGLTIANGYTSGSDAIYPYSGYAQVAGGGILHGRDDAQGGSLTLTNCTVSANMADSQGTYSSNAGGGGIANFDGSLTLNNCTVAGNWATGNVRTLDPAWGGGILNYGGILAVNNSTFSGNTAGGGGYVDKGTFSILGNDPGGGGGIWADQGGQLVVNGCTFSGNRASLFGNDIVNNASTAAVSNSTFSGGSSLLGAGGIGIMNETALTVTNSTVAGNSSKGIYNDGTLTVSNSTIAGNSGIGISNVESVCYDHSTQQWVLVPAPLTVCNSIIAQNQGGDVVTGTGGGLPLNDINGRVVSLGHNLIGNADGSTGWMASDLTGTSASPLDPKLAPLGNYGGPTQTMALLPGSPAIGAGDNTNGGLPVPPTDQRGLARIANGTIDIGAFETQANASTLTSGTGAVVTLQSPAGTTLTDVTALPPPSKQDVVVNGSRTVTFPIGVFHFQVQTTPGASAEVVILVPTGTKVNAYYKQNPADGKWYKYTAASFQDRNGDGTPDVVLPLTDGVAPGDADGLANGVINDPGAPALEQLEVQIDVKPGDATNSVNLASQGVISVALFGAADFNTAGVDVASVRFAGAAAVSYSWADLNGDGQIDLVLNFRTQDTNLRAVYDQLLADDIDADGVLDSNQQEAQVSLTGDTTSDALFVGTDQMDLFLTGKALRQTLDQLAAAGAL